MYICNTFISKFVLSLLHIILLVKRLNMLTCIIVLSFSTNIVDEIDLSKHNLKNNLFHLQVVISAEQYLLLLWRQLRSIIKGVLTEKRKEFLKTRFFVKKCSYTYLKSFVQ